MSGEKSDLAELCGLWWQEKNGKRYLSGTLGGCKLLVFDNEFKRDNPKAPDMRVMIAPKPREKSTTTSNEPGGNDGTTTGRGGPRGAGDLPF